MVTLLLLSELLLTPLCGSSAGVICSAIAQDQVNLDKALVRWGNAATFDPSKKPLVGTVRSTEVYLKIPAYKRIQEEKVPPGSARYNQLMREATAVYRRVLEQVGRSRKAALIVEQGGISGYAGVADFTGAIIAAL